MLMLGTTIFIACKKFIRDLIPLIFFVFYAAELINGLTQCIRNYGSENLNLSIKGNLQNSGIYSCYLTVFLPLIIWQIEKLLRRKILIQYSVIILLFCVVLIISFTQSRTSWMVFCIVMYTQYSSSIHLRLQCLLGRRILGPIFLIGSLLAFWLLFSLKPNSSYGRLLIWKIACQNFFNRPILGIGIGRFSVEYPTWQINYFSTHSNLANYFFLNGDETFVAFNEPLQILVETGFVGFCFLTIIIILILKRKMIDFKLNRVLKITLILILVSSFFTYSLHCNIILLLFIYCIFFLLRYVNLNFFSLRFIKFHQINKIALVLFFLYNVFFFFKQYNSIQQWVYIREDVILNSTIRKQVYEGLYSNLFLNGKFLLDYAQQLEGKDIFLKKKLLSECQNKYTSLEYFEALKDFYLEMQDTVSAIKVCEKIIDFVPSKYSSRFELMQLYYNVGNILKTREVGNSILFMPMKKSTPEIINIQAQTKDIFKKINLTN